MAGATNAFIKPFVSVRVSIRTHSKMQKCTLGEYPRVAKSLDEVERLTVNQDVTGSSPVTGASNPANHHGWRDFALIWCLFWLLWSL